ncbi:unnamed protein product [Plutella xylostella]|uniref:Putative nuclease HARBI1 n=1 Tax=Plutella xylostella TaxID=51655 RepID=A0A8S4FKK0_PLUXY|nr:unnamed protein product [Plutella xylostella]
MDVMNNLINIQLIARIDANRVRRRRKVYRRRKDPFTLDDIEFKKRYRFNKDTVRRITHLVRHEITRGPRGLAVSPELQVLTALRCWARNEVQDDSGELHGISQATVCRICARVARALARLSDQFIAMPNTLQEQEQVMREFRAIRNFPNVIGAIDCTHIKIKKTGGDMAQYYINRKGYYSLNVQVVCDARLRITDIVARWRGSTHDARIFNESSIKDRFEHNAMNGRLLGDSGYACTPYLFTPVPNPRTPQEERYNEAQIATRNTVERCFGVWKQRFRCLLHGLPISLQNGKVVIMALAVLHNIAIDMADHVGKCY